MFKMAVTKNNNFHFRTVHLDFIKDLFISQMNH